MYEKINLQSKYMLCYLVSQEGWLTVNDYFTFAWALAPEGYQTGTDANCSVAFYCMFIFDIKYIILF